MRALFVAPSAYPLGGVASWLDYLLPGMRSAGVDAHLGLVSGARFHDVDRYIEVHPSVVERIHSATGTTEGRTEAICRSIQKVRPDVVVAVNIPDVFLAVNRLRQEKRSSVRAVMALHSLECDVIEDARRYQEAVDGFIVVNRLIRRKLIGDIGIPETRVHYAPCGAELHRPRSVDRQSPAFFRILYAGRLDDAQKRCMDVVALVQEIESKEVPFRLDVVGDGPDRSEMQSALRQYVDNGKVVFHGTVSRERLAREFLLDADILLITSRWETGPIVAWEAMSAGVPVVSSAYIGSGAEDALQPDENSCLFEVGDCRRAAAIIEKLWISPELRRRLACAGLELVKTRYSEVTSTAAWVCALRAVIQGAIASAVDLPVQTQSGRLNRFLSPRGAEPLRCLAAALRLRAPPVAPGAEWPHSHSSCAGNDEHWRRLEFLDRRDGHHENDR